MKKKSSFLVMMVLLISSLLPASFLTVYGEEVLPLGETILFQDFEDEDAGSWIAKPWGDGGDIGIYDWGDNKSLVLENRESKESQPFLDITSLMESGKKYNISLKLRLEEGTGEYHITGKVASGGAEDYPWLVGNREVTSEDWTIFELKDYQVPSETTEFLLWIEPGEGTDEGDVIPNIYIDDVEIIEIYEITEVLSQDFEDEDMGSWIVKPWGDGGDLSIYDWGDNKSLVLENRESKESQPFMDITNLMESGKKYNISLKLRLEEGTGEYHITAKVVSGGEEDYIWLIGNREVTSEDWTIFELKDYQVPSETTEFLIWIEPGEGTDEGEVIPNIYMDDVLITSTSASEPEELDEDLFYNFESGTTQSWRARGGVKLEVVDEEAYAGSYSLKTTGRTQTWEGPSINLLNLLEKDTEYTVCAYLKVVEIPEELEEPLTLAITMEELAAGADSKDWKNIATIEVTDTQWIQISGSYIFEEDMDEMTLYVESNHPEVGFYMDNVSIGKDQTGINANFEDGIGNWVIRDSSNGSIELITEDNHTENGSQSLSATVSSQYNGPILDVMGKMHRGHKYHLSAWVKMAEGEVPTALRISVQSGSDTYTNVSEDVTVTDEGWVELSGDFTLTVDPTVLNAYVETVVAPDSDVTFYMDDFVISYVGPVGAGKPIQTDLTPIKDAYKDYFLVGNIVSSVDLQGQRLELLKHHFNVLTAENAMKPDYAYNAEREFDFTAQNQLVAGVKEAGFDMFGHVLVWHQQMPTWLSTDEEGNPLSREEALENLTTHITTVVENFGDQVIGWDVVNEAIKDGLTDTATPDNWQWALRESSWYKAIGPDYIEIAFRTAREVLDKNGWTDVKLYYNDYNDDNQQKASVMYSMVKDINDRYAAENDGRLLIDGIGMQSHYNANTNVENVRLSLERFSELGVEISITELDITSGSNSVLTEKEAIAQAYLYAELFKLYKEYSDHIARVTIWGLDDASSWRSEGSPVLFDAGLQAKLAYYAIMDPEKFIEENPREVREAKEAKAVYGTPVIDGEIDDVWKKAPKINTDQYQTAWQGATGVGRMLWDDENLYVLIEVQDDVLDKSHSDPWEQDSVEIFVDQTNSKSTFYEGTNHGQYRINFENETSFNPQSAEEGFESATSVSGTNYIVEVKIPFTEITPAKNTTIGFDIQVNDAKNGSRQSCVAWNDITGTGYMDPSVFGNLVLVDKIDSSEGGKTPGGSKPSGGSRSAGKVDEGKTEEDEEDEIPGSTEEAVVELIVDDEGKAVASVTDEIFETVLNTAKDGKAKVKVKDGEKESDVSVKFNAEQMKEALEAGIKVIEADTGIAVVELPVSLFKDSEDNVEVVLSVSKEDNDVYIFDLSVGEEKLNQFDKNQKVNVSFNYTLDASLNPEQIVVCYIADNGDFKVVKNGHYNDGIVQFKAVQFGKYTAVPVNVTLKDLDDTSWAKDAIIALAARKIIKGVSEDSFAPLKNVTRAEFAQMLVNTFNLESEGQNNPFSDVESGAWYEKAIITAYELGIVKGRTDGSFGVNDQISRQDMAVMTFNTLKTVGITLDLKEAAVDFKDDSEIAGYAKEAVKTMQQAGIIRGMETGEFAPLANANRAQAAVILYKLIDEL